MGLLNRRLAYLDKVNPDVAQIRKNTPTNIEQGWEYVKLLLQKTSLGNSAVEIWLNKKYHSLEESQPVQSMDTRPIAAALVYLAGKYNGEEISKKTIMHVMKPLTEITLNDKISEVKTWLNL